MAAYGQTTKPLTFQVELGSYITPQFTDSQRKAQAGSADRAEIPFWLRANQYGIVPRGENVYTLRTGLRVDYHGAPVTAIDSLRASHRHVDWGWGFDLAANANGFNANRTKPSNMVAFVLPEAYVKMRIRGIEAWGGRRREIIGLADSSLSTGSYIWSGNAVPPLKIQLNTVGWVPLTRWLYVNALYAHGWFEYNRFVKGSMLHQKALYLRLGSATGKFWFIGGMNHSVQWGGNNESLPSSFIRNSQLPASSEDYIDVVLGSSLGDRLIDTTKYSPFDAGNRIGNHLGTVDLGMEFRGKAVSVFFYRQSIYEDGSLFYLINIADGLHGTRFTNNRPNRGGFRLNRAVLEYLNTYSQGGGEFINEDPSKRGRDNYFNHGQYRDGWSSYGRTIGTPFIAPATDLPSRYPGNEFTNNNRVRVYHVGLSGQFSKRMGFTGKFSYSQNLGIYDAPFNQMAAQFSGMIGLYSQLNWLGGTVLNTTVGYDKGDLYENNLGLFVSLKKSGLIKSRFTK
ncbi:capsule assembly Wzi family protein [Fibrella rubiginis]|uniref:capsule assembly Wzi family protein n=1 Tax=Fibrella rubiginis TaxID=2817060 RepID=UPI001E3542D0|nr:capsule assembly Wzi family protein [Fibrella rubiginis]